MSCRRESMFLPWHVIICPHRPVTAASGHSDLVCMGGKLQEWGGVDGTTFLAKNVLTWPREHRVSAGSRPVQGNIGMTVQLGETCQYEWMGLRHVGFLSQVGTHKTFKNTSFRVDCVLRNLSKKQSPFWFFFWNVSGLTFPHHIDRKPLQELWEVSHRIYPVSGLVVLWCACVCTYMHMWGDQKLTLELCSFLDHYVLNKKHYCVWTWCACMWACMSWGVCGVSLPPYVGSWDWTPVFRLEHFIHRTILLALHLFLLYLTSLLVALVFMASEHEGSTRLCLWPCLPAVGLQTSAWFI